MRNDEHADLFPGTTPSLGLRGLHLDLCRHFIEPATILRIIDKMALLRLNLLQLHLSDDQAFPVQFLRTPEIRPTQALTVTDQLRIARACRDAGIELIPEINLPGHCKALLSFFDPTIQPERRLGLTTPERIDLDRDLPFILGLFEELVERFGSRRIHLGGDEAPGYARFPELIRTVCGWAADRGLEVVAWDDVLETLRELPANLIIQRWRAAVHPSIRQARVIQSHGYSLDHLDDPFRLYERAPNEEGLLLGCVACLWTELVTNRTVERTLFPGLYLLAHRWWHYPRQFADPPTLLRQLSERFGYPVTELDDWRMRRWVGFTAHHPRSCTDVTVEDPLDREEDLLPAFSRSLVVLADALWRFVCHGAEPDAEERLLLLRLGLGAYNQDLTFLWDRPPGYVERVRKLVGREPGSPLFRDGLRLVLGRTLFAHGPRLAPGKPEAPDAALLADPTAWAARPGTLHARSPEFQLPTTELERRIQWLLGQIPFGSKLKLVSGAPQQGATQAYPQAGIIEYRLADGPLGVHWWTDRSTAYPATIGLAASFDRELAHRYGAALGRDARARGVHILLGPGVNLYRSPLCGRNFEYLGEDPYLAGQLAAAYVRGVQSQGVAATVKHFALNFQEYDRRGISADVDERTLHEVYLAPFRAAVVEGGAGCVMTAYGRVNGVPCAEHRELLGILKEQWGFDGVVMSDWGSTHSTAGSVNAGLDLEMPTGRWFSPTALRKALRAGAIDIETIVDKVRRLLRLGLCFGWFDREQQDPAIPLEDPETAAVALEAARSGIVLLRNKNGVLPLDRNRIRRLAVLGELAHPGVPAGGGSAYTPAHHEVSLLDGIRGLAGPGIEVIHEPGTGPGRERRVCRSCAWLTPNGASAGVLGEYFVGERAEGTPVASRIDPRIDFDWPGLEPPIAGLSGPVFAVRWTGRFRAVEHGPHQLLVTAGHNPYRLLVRGRELLASQGSRSWLGLPTATAQIFLAAGEECEFVLEFQRSVTPRSGIRVGWCHAGDAAREWARALNAARSADAVVVAAGFGAELEGEDHDRPFGLPQQTELFLRDVGRANPATVVVLLAGGAVDVLPWLEDVAGLLAAWYPGQEGGTALAELLFGDVNPGGRLPFTWERRLTDRPASRCYHDEDGDGRVALLDGLSTGYRGFVQAGIEPLFPFGFGLSYSRFEYDNLRLSRTQLGHGDELIVTCDVINYRGRGGAEVVQLYVADPVSSLPRPPFELKGFCRVYVAAGGRQPVTFRLGPEHLSYHDPDLRRMVLEPGRFQVLLGASATDIRLRGEFEVVR